MSKKLDILTESLKKKESVLDDKFNTHFDTVAQANGQPLNDKRNGHKTLAKWEKQNDDIRNQMASIEKTKNAIEREEQLIANVESFIVPKFLAHFIESGQIIQWRKYPNRFFVNGVDKGRLIWDIKKQKLLYSHLTSVPKDQIAKFKEVARIVFAEYRKEFPEN